MGTGGGKKPLGPGDTPGYEIVRRAGKGASGEVYEARDITLDRVVALKVYSPAFLSDTSSAARFVREAQLLARHPHEGLVPVYDAQLEQAPAYIAFGWMSGGDLVKKITAGGCPAATVTAYGARLARALEHLHGHGILHRDVKPENVLLDERETVYLADLGLGLVEKGEGLTETGHLVGTPLYMAPEVIEHGQYSPASDLYSLGITLLELCVGRRLGEIALRVNELQDVLLEVHDRPLRRVLRRLLRTNPAERYAAADEVAEDLEILASRSESHTTVAASPRPLAASERLRLVLVGACTGALLVLGVVAARRLGAPPTALPAEPRRDEPAAARARWEAREADARAVLEAAAAGLPWEDWEGSKTPEALDAAETRFIGPQAPLRVQRVLRGLEDWLSILRTPPPAGPGSVEAAYARPTTEWVFQAGAVDRLGNWLARFRSFYHEASSMTDDFPGELRRISDVMGRWNARRDELREAFTRFEQGQPPPELRGVVLETVLLESAGALQWTRRGPFVARVIPALRADPRAPWAARVLDEALRHITSGDMALLVDSCDEAERHLRDLREVVTARVAAGMSPAERRNPPGSDLVVEVVKGLSACPESALLRDELARGLDALQGWVGRDPVVLADSVLELSDILARVERDDRFPRDLLPALAGARDELGAAAREAR